jgi:hypothetical protein
MRDYDEYPIIIKDYGVVFTGILLFMVIVIIASYFMGHYPKNEFKELVDTINFLSAMCFIFYVPYLFLLEIPKNFKRKPSFFEFSDDKIYYCHISYEDKNDKITYEITAPIKHVKQVSFCIVTEVFERQGRKDYLSAWRIFFCKSSIAIPLSKLFWFMYYLCTYIF